MNALALFAILPASASLYFFVFWHWFDYWRRHRAQTYTVLLGTVLATAVALYACRNAVLVGRIAMPVYAQAIGWAIIVLAIALGTIADRQIGFRVRSFLPFFDERGRIELTTTGAYAVVRHPIYAAGIAFQLGATLVTGYPAVAVSCAVLAIGATWFTRQEERRLIGLLDDPAAYEHYRNQVPALLPRLGRRRPSAAR
jgi:protein-S-isoprenylcysteine O-methyltransferase Ste14